MNEIKKIVVNGADGQREYGIEDSVARQDVQEIVSGAPEELDSFREAFEAFKEGGEALASITESVERNAEAIVAETERAMEEETIIEEGILAEQRRAEAAEQGLSGVITAEAKRVDEKIANERARAEAAEQGLSGVITAEAKRVDEKIANERARAEAAELANFNAIGNEVARATQAEADAVERGRQLALRALFVAAGAEYNNSGVDKTKTAPWGETVTHKAGYYYLNGLGDITEGQMLAIYNAPHSIFAPHVYSFKKSRTIFLTGNGTFGALRSYECYYWFYNASVEVVGNADLPLFLGGENTFVSAFNGCAKLKYISMLIYCQGCKLTNTFKGCKELIHVRMERVDDNLSFAESPNISKNTIKHAIVNARPGNKSISITLHPDAYARLANDADIVAALAAQPLITLVSA